MLSLKQTQVHSLKIEGNNDFFYSFTSDNEFPIRRYIEKKYGYSGGFFYCDDEYTGEAFKFLTKKAKLLSYTSVGKTNSIKNGFYEGMRGGTFWFYYKNVYIRISMKNQPDEHENFVNTSLSVAPKVYTSDQEDEETELAYQENEKIFSILFCAPITVQKFPIEDFEPFILTKTKGRIHIFIKNQYGEYDFEPIKLDNSKKVDIELNYGKKFSEIHETILNRLNQNTNGLYMFHGAPGTGKTTYIKYLTNVIERDFIYVPTNMLEYFTTDPNSLSMLLRKPNSVLILEDAEKAILKREDGGSSSSVSSLLNLSDGIMSDIMKTSIIVTYNCSKHDIDDALRRKGRLQIDYEFGLLPVDDAKELAESLNYPNDFINKEITEPISLADIYNLQTKVDFLDKKEKTNRIIGFGQ
jgi:hypothetical protein